MIIAVNSPTSGKTLEQRCTYADFMIGCLSVEPGSKVAIHLVMQEPLLRSAKTDAERNRLVTSRVQKETGGLLSTAEQHLSASQGR